MCARARNWYLLQDKFGAIQDQDTSGVWPEIEQTRQQELEQARARESDLYKQVFSLNRARD